MIRLYVEALPAQKPHQARFTAVLYPAFDCEEAARKAMAHAWGTGSPIVLLTEAHLDALRGKLASWIDTTNTTTIDELVERAREDFGRLELLEVTIGHLFEAADVALTGDDYTGDDTVALLRRVRELAKRAPVSPTGRHAGPWEMVSPELFARFDVASGRPLVTLAPIHSTINGSPVPAWRWAVLGTDLCGSATGSNALANAMRDADASLAADGCTLAPQRAFSAEASP